MRGCPTFQFAFQALHLFGRQSCRSPKRTPASAWLRLLAPAAHRLGRHTDRFRAAVIGTGGQATIGNNALRDALARPPGEEPSVDRIVDVTLEEQTGEGRTAPTIALGDLRIRGARVTYGDMHLFEYLHMVDRPALLLGMDTLGLLDTLVIDYRRHELQAKLADGR